MTEPIKVVVVEDHPMVAAGLLALLEPVPDLQVVADVRSVREALAAVERLQPHVVCMDHELPDGTGVEATREIRRRWPTVQVVMLTASDDDQVLAEAMEAGCSGFLTKGAGRVEQLLVALRGAAAGEITLSPALLGRLLPHLRRNGSHPGVDLTGREQEVLQLLANGLATTDIAERLVISFATTRNHIQNILSKLGAHSKLEAVTVAVRAGLVSVEQSA